MTRVHRGLVWLAGDPGRIDLIARDPQIAPLVVARPAPGVLGFLPGSSTRLQARLLKLGAAPRRSEAKEC